MAKFSRFIVIIFVAIIYYQVISGKKDIKNGKKDTKEQGNVPVNKDDPDVKAAFEFAFGSDQSKKKVEFIDGHTNNSNPVVYKLKAKITETFECSEDNSPQTNNQIVETDEGCQVLISI